MNIYSAHSVENKSLIPLLGSLVKAGFPSPADDYVEAQLDLHDEMVAHPASTFFIKVTGDSMIGAGIVEGDLLVVDRSLTPKSGDTVLAILNGDFTVKYFNRTANEVILCPANPKYPQIHIKENDEFEVWGVVTHAVHYL